MASLIFLVSLSEAHHCTLEACSPSGKICENVRVCDRDTLIVPATNTAIPEPPKPRDPFALPKEITHEIYVTSSAGWVLVVDGGSGYFVPFAEAGNGVILGTWIDPGNDLHLWAVMVPVKKKGIEL